MAKELTIQEALERGIQYAAIESVFETGGAVTIFNIATDAEEMREYTDLVYCKKVSGGYDADFLYNLIHQALEEDDEIYIEDASVITADTEELIEALAAKMNENFNKRNFVESLKIKVKM